MKIVIEAGGAEVTLKAGGSFVKVDPSGGVTVSGPLVRMNSGGGGPGSGSGGVGGVKGGPLLPNGLTPDGPVSSTGGDQVADTGVRSNIESPSLYVDEVRPIEADLKQAASFRNAARKEEVFSEVCSVRSDKGGAFMMLQASTVSESLQPLPPAEHMFLVFDGACSKHGLRSWYELGGLDVCPLMVLKDGVYDGVSALGGPMIADLKASTVLKALWENNHPIMRRAAVYHTSYDEIGLLEFLRARVQVIMPEELSAWLRLGDAG